MAGHIGDMVSQHWNTPDNLLESVRKVLHDPIDLDPCDNQWSTTKARVSYVLPGHNGLTDSWLVAPDGSRITNVFCNPPYGTCYLYENRDVLTRDEYKALPDELEPKVVITSLEDWVQRCANYGSQGQEIFLLIPSSTETGFWHDYIYPTADAICWIRGRVKHPLEGKPVASSTKGSAMIFWGATGRAPVFEREFEPHGKVWIL